MRDREIWTAVARRWYTKATDETGSPSFGRLHHQLAILARPNAVLQLFLYTKSLCAAIPFRFARNSISSLLYSAPGYSSGLPDLHAASIHSNVSQKSEYDKQDGISLKLQDYPLLEAFKNWAVNENGVNHLKCLNQHNAYTARFARRWMEPGAFTSIANTRALLEHGQPDANTVSPRGQGSLAPLVLDDM